MKKFIFILLIIINYIGFSQNVSLSPVAEISIITIGQGSELNDSFGHSAIRIVDKINQFDVTYNYGVFNFHEKGFYIKFMRGKLLYSLGKDNTYSFLKYYINQNRNIREQVLNLTPLEKQQYFNFIQNNAKPENRKYLYDFFFDNCATKLREVNTLVLNTKVDYKDELLNSNATFRELITQKLNNQVWGKFGIDIALGSIIDRKATAKESTFLPDYVFKSFKNATTNIKGTKMPLVKKTNYLYKKTTNNTTQINNNNIFSPMLLFSIIALICLFITYKDYKNKVQSKWLDFTILLTTGLVGLIVLLLWFATDHKATANNFNILWAFTPNLIVAFYIFKHKKFIKNYYLLLLILLLITTILWIFKIQIFNMALIPIFILLIVRYLYIWKVY